MMVEGGKKFMLMKNGPKDIWEIVRLAYLLEVLIST